MAMVMWCWLSALLRHAARFQTIGTCRISKRPELHLFAWLARNILHGQLAQWVIVVQSDFCRLLCGSLLVHTQHLLGWGTLSRAVKIPFCRARCSGLWTWMTLLWLFWLLRDLQEGCHPWCTWLLGLSSSLHIGCSSCQTPQCLGGAALPCTIQVILCW